MHAVYNAVFVVGFLAGKDSSANFMVETIQWTDEGVVMIDQTRLPREEVFVTCKDYKEVAEAIRSMVIRGAPAIGVAAAMGVAIGVLKSDDLHADFDQICTTLARTRPTAVNLFWAIDRMKNLYRAGEGQADRGDPRDARSAKPSRFTWRTSRSIKAIGRNGADLVPDGKTVLTHCNAGALATAGSARRSA